MQHTIDDTLKYILFLTRHIRRRNVRSAILAVLMELRCPEHHDGFGYLRKAVFLKYSDSDLRFGVIYQSVAEECDTGTTVNQVDQDIRAVVGSAWSHRDAEKWEYVFPADEKGIQTKPSNGRFIARLGCLMELWYDCCEEECYAGQVHSAHPGSGGGDDHTAAGRAAEY